MNVEKFPASILCINGVFPMNPEYTFSNSLANVLHKIVTNPKFLLRKNPVL